jgi:hypothetical protein
MELQPRQFTAYRGLIVDTGRAPEDDEEILSRLRPGGRDSTLYGPHWSTDQSVAQRFATNPTAGGYETQPAKMRRFSGPVDKWGVVLEAHVQGRGGDSSEPYSDHEREVRVHRPDFDHKAANHAQRVTAHVYDQPSLRAIEAPTGRQRMEIFRQSARVPVRSFEIPRERWT